MWDGRESICRSVSVLGVCLWMFAVCARGDTTVVTDPIGEKWNYIFMENLGTGNLVEKVSQADGKSVRQEFDERNNLTSRTDPEGRTTTHAYNEYNQRVSTTVAAGTPQARTTTYQYLSPDIDLPAVVSYPSVFSGATRTVTTQYDEDLNVISKTIDGYDRSGNPLSRTTAFEYNNVGQLTRIDGPRTDVADITTMTYYDCATGAECGQLETVVNALGHTTTYDDYDANGRLLRKTDPNGVETTYTYHPRGWAQRITETPPGSESRVTDQAYDGLGQVTSVTAPDGAERIRNYDAAHDLRTTTDSLGNSVEYFYDLKGNRIREDTRDPDGTLVRRLERSFDIRDHIHTITRGRGESSPGSTTRMVTDAAGNLLSRTDPNSNPPTLYQYDALNRLTRVLDAFSNPVEYQYDAQDNQTEITVPNGASTSYEYDDLGNLLREDSPDRGTVSRAYDNAGNMVSETDARGVTVSYTYDALNRLTSADYPGDHEDVALVYDDCGFGVGRLCAQSDAGGDKTLDYDPFGNIVAVHREMLGRTYVTSYRYDVGDRIVSVAYPSGRVVSVTRDEIGRITDMITTVDGESTQVVSDRTYRSDGLSTGQTFGNGLTENRTHDLRGRLTNQALATSMGRSYDYDANGNLLRVVDAEGQRQYSYDALDRLLGAAYGGTSLAYGYDANGNRLSADRDGALIPYSYEPQSNRLKDIEGVPVNLDVSGNTLANNDSNQSFSYNDSGRLSRVLEGGVEAARYTYDAQGLRTTKETPQQTTVFHHDLQGQVIAETGEDGSVRREYLYVESSPVAMIVSEDEPGGPAVLTSPREDATLDATPVLFEWEVDESQVDRVLLRVGTHEKGRNLFDADVTGDASHYVDVPLTGEDVHVTLYSLMDGEWTSRGYVFNTSGNGTENVAVLTSPVDGSTLDTTPVMFQWTVDATVVDRVLLRVGTDPGGRDLLDSDVTGANTLNVDIPMDGNDVHATLYSLVQGHWTAREYAFSTVADGTDNVAVLSSPPDGTVLDTTPVSFQWTVDESAVERVLLRVGTTVRGRDLLDSDVSGSLARHVDIPLDGNDVHVTLYSLLDGHWTTREYRFKTTNGGTEKVAVLTAPADGVVLDTTPVRFEWTVDESLAERVLLRVGTAPLGREHYDLDVTGGTSRYVDVPLDGNHAYVTLYTLIDGHWTTREYMFGTTAGGTENVAALVRPATGESLTATPTLFEWTVDETVVEQVLLRVGTTPGGRDVYDADVTGVASRLVDIPMDGNDIHVTLYSLVDGRWTKRVYVFPTSSEGTDNIATLATPVVGEVLDATPVPLEWNVDESVVDGVLLRVGSSAGGRNIADFNVTGTTSRFVDIPLGGDDVHVTLYSLVEGRWATRAYVFQTSEHGTDNVAVLTSPGNGVTLDTTPVHFQWAVDQTFVERVLLRVGTARGGRDLFDRDVSSKTSQHVDVPLDGGSVYVTLYSLVDGHWTMREYMVVTTEDGTENVATLEAPTGDVAIDTTPSRFSWTVDESVVEQVILRVGTTPGSRDLHDADVTGATTRLVDVPLTGEEVYATLYSLLDGHWTRREYTFATVAGGTENVAHLVSPPAGSTLSTKPVALEWAIDPAVVDGVLLRIGYEPGGRDVVDVNVTGTTTYSVDLPLDGRDVHVTLYSLLDGQWTTRAYVLQTESQEGK